MILRHVVTVLVCIDTFGSVLAASYSNVYFQLGTNGAPAVDGSYDAPGAYKNSQAQLAPLTLPPVIPVLPVTTLVAPCPVPCINPSQPVSNANLVAYKPSNKPSDDGSTNYGYSYVVFDDGTGDKKSQYEVSDGGKVSGRYSIDQPDGYVREVQYTADDLKGFRAVVTNFLRGKVISSAEENNKKKDSMRLLALKENLIDSSKGTEKGQKSNNRADKGEQLAEVKEIKPLPSSPSQETPVKAAVEEIKPKPTKPSNKSVTESNNFNVYGNIIKCIQTSMKNSESPLVYVILPSKVCP